MKLSPRFFAIAGAAALVAVYGGFKYAVTSGKLGHATTVVAAVPLQTRINQFHVEDMKSSYALPVSTGVRAPSTTPTIEVLAWNAEDGLILANGGTSTQRGSLVDKFTGGGAVNLVRQDDYGQMEANLAKFVSSSGSSGDFGFIIMGDAYPYVSAALDKLGLKGKYAAISTFGFSDGEDQCMLPSNWRDMLKNHQPILIAAVPRDGDWNICVKFAADNGIKINVDQKTVDLDAFNFTEVNSFTDADEKLISQAKEDRKVVRDRIAHETVSVTVNGVATWTPGDVDAVKRYPGSIVGVASTHDYQGQMPALLIVASDWAAANRSYVVGLLKAADRGAMAIRVNNALDAMDAAAQSVFQDKAASPGYWKTYYQGSVGTNGAGERVRLGGSKVATLQEARDYFGLRAGTTDTFASVFRVFKAYDETYYPDLYPAGTISAYNTVIDTSYLLEALKDIPESAVAPVSVANLLPAQPISRVVANKSYHIEFNTGSAVIKPESYPVLQAILDSAAISSGLRLRLSGFTDDTGSNVVNVPLSRARAQAVADYLHAKAPVTFTKDKFEVSGYGSGDTAHPPVCAELTIECRAQNRRVMIEQGD